MLHGIRTDAPLPAPGAAPARVATRYCHLDDDRDIGLRLAATLLSAEETDRAARFRFRRDADRYIRAHGFLRRTLAAATGQGAASLSFGVEGNGKPVLAGGGVHFNLSHSGGLAAVAVSHRGPVGIDVETIDRAIDMETMIPACFADEEVAVLAGLSGPALTERFFAFWTAKEARMKLTGEGMSLPPLEIALALAAGWPVGCLRPAGPVTHLYFDDGCPIGSVCCIAVDGGRG